MNEQQANIDYEKKAMEYLDTMGMSKQLNDSQKKLFIELASAYQLNPFKREIYPIVYKNKSGVNEISLVTGYEVYIQRANQSGLLDGWSWDTEGEIVFKTDLRTSKEGRNYQTKAIDRDKSTLKATVTIHRKDWKHPFMHSISIDEFSGESGIWLQSPKFMLKKTCASQAFRLCFSKELSGIPYTSEETTTFKHYSELQQEAKEQELKPQPEEKEVNEEPESESSLVNELCRQAEDLFQRQFLTEKKKQNIIDKAKDPATTQGLLHFLVRQLALFNKLYELTTESLISESEKVELYRSILSAKANDLNDLEKALNHFEQHREVA